MVQLPTNDRADAEAPGRAKPLRRLLLGGALAGLVALPVPTLASRIAMVVYVYADDCSVCQLFQNQDWPTFRASPASRAVTFVRTTAPKTTQAYQARYWPSEARPFLSAVKVPIVPSFILVQKRDVVMVGNGIAGWRKQVLPYINRLAAG